MFLLYSPLNQGLKQAQIYIYLFSIYVFTLQSIKSRIETYCYCVGSIWIIGFLLYSPLNQGLKLFSFPIIVFFLLVFTLQSIKSRIETTTTFISYLHSGCFYSTVH